MAELQESGSVSRKRFEAGWVDCGCCAGTEWGGEYPRECRDCGGTGRQYRYASGHLALWPGGPFCGQEHPDYARTTYAR